MKIFLFLTLILTAAFYSCSPSGEQKAAETSAAPEAAAPAAVPEAAPPAQQPAETAAKPSPMKSRPTETVKAKPSQAQSSPAQPAPRAAVVPAGTVIAVRTTSVISTKTHKAGETFSASLAEPLTVGGRTLAPQGAEVTGRVVEADPGGRVQGRASLVLQLTSIELAGGRSLPVRTSTFAQEAEGSKKGDATKIGVGAGLGAAIGAIAGGGRGAAIGAGVGGAAGTGAVLATRGNAAEVPSESLLRFTLAAPAKAE
jgi:hypothetical protein